MVSTHERERERERARERDSRRAGCTGPKGRGGCHRTKDTGRQAGERQPEKEQVGVEWSDSEIEAHSPSSPRSWRAGRLGRFGRFGRFGLSVAPPLPLPRCPPRFGCALMLHLRGHSRGGVRRARSVRRRRRRHLHVRRAHRLPCRCQRRRHLPFPPLHLLEPTANPRPSAPNPKAQSLEPRAPPPPQ
eukprot:COSAG02_NODE_3340_length_6901_cov_5.132167_4_plen_188_part_00